MELKYKFTVPVKTFLPRPDKNPLGYTRTTQRGAKFDPKALMYEAWKDHVWKCFMDDNPEFSISPEKGQKCEIRMFIYYKDNVKADASNVFKGIEDALADKTIKVGRIRKTLRRLYRNDNYCIGSFDFDYDKTNPRVECQIIF